MKMTLHIDDALLARIMTNNGITSKTKAVDYALRELDRRSELKRIATEGLGLTPEELKKAFDPASYDDRSCLLNETAPKTYGRKSRSR